jgi:hypothetical protein
VGGIGAVSITRPGLGVPLDIADVTLTAGKAAAVMLELVMEPGDVLQAFLQDAQMAVWVSGSVLQGVGIIPPAAQQRPSIPGFMPLTSS